MTETKHQPPTCKCGSLLSATTWTCVRGIHCPVENPPRPRKITGRSALRVGNVDRKEF